MKRLKYVFILILLFINISSIFAFNNTNKIYDYGQMLSYKDEALLKKKIGSFIKKNNIDMVVVTVKYHSKSNTLEYANDFYKYNKFGLNDSNDGVILVIDLNKNNSIVTNAYGNARKILNSSRLKDIEYSINNDTSSYSKKIQTFINKTDKYITNNYMYESSYTKSINHIPFTLITLISLGISIILSLIIYLRSKNKIKKEYKNLYLKDDSFNINLSVDKFITTHTNSFRTKEKE